MKNCHLLWLVLVAVLGLATPAVAQLPCVGIGDDLFNAVPWCVPAPLPTNLPVFPNLTQQGNWCCLFNCNLENTFPVSIATTHTMVACDYAVISITFRAPAGAIGPGFTGVMLGKYSRTWLETGIPGVVSRQVCAFWSMGTSSRLRMPGRHRVPCLRIRRESRRISRDTSTTRAIRTRQAFRCGAWP